MNPVRTHCFFPLCLKPEDIDPAARIGSSSSTDTGTDREKNEGREKLLLCASCRRMITRPDEKISIHNAHQHSFANPSGLIFEIGCFRSAIGCGYTGILTEEWTWFRGFRWKLAACGTCLVQLGWLFVSKNNERFNGLILNRLISGKKEVP